MSPIRVALIGLSASAKTSWAAEFHLPYLLSERGRKSYTLVALCNTSVAAAQASLDHFNLDPNIKIYGNSEDLSRDPDIDLLVVATRVDVHHVAIPSIRAGKDVFIEWPLAENLAAAEHLAKLAHENGSKTFTGLQGRYAPPVIKVCGLLASGAVGKVISSDVRALRTVFDPRGLPESLEYFTDIKVGGNLISVVLGHVMDFIHSTLGEYAEYDSRAQIQKPNVTLLSGGYGSFSDNDSRTVTSNVPDMVSMPKTWLADAVMARTTRARVRGAMNVVAMLCCVIDVVLSILCCAVLC
ncbi:Galactose/lactose metabolism regulatory protein GAL80 [Fulvia fulva]|uniref:Galactose/lactose metabolism regulatory protein GAL80 n=1 Tax=Passalora fulva TaxID=5499 RepID=A0A9Q8URT9_PASFU|nr:Galactose/lactose metabolism regulatory protein GAL80 [Fulvia fulva]KAK4620569.1 Galactose/lactose metabolism regulatory protein GAL80 [Fulvia fulva]UJO20066.1 Galactose/lactose metabolism regulatory protein GAL80 [Fulvia fulva]